MLYRQAFSGSRILILLTTVSTLFTLTISKSVNVNCPPSKLGRNNTNVIYVKKGNHRENRCHSIPGKFKILHESDEVQSYGKITKFLLCKPRGSQRITLTFYGTIENATPLSKRVQVISCLQDKDTLTVESGDKNDSQQVQVFVRFQPTKRKFGIVTVHDDQQSVHFDMRKSEVNGTAINIKKKLSRSPRNVNDGKQKTKKLSMAMTDISACGSTKGCFRYDDNRQCGHLSCKYFISYSFNSETEIVNIELSAKTSGWVAIGFSSDETMGGMDYIIACMRDKYNSNAIRVADLRSEIGYMQPTTIRTDTNITHYMEKDGYIYCKLIAKDKEHNLELTNEWHHQYAWGPMSSDGDHIGKHTQTPLISKRKISLLEKINDFTNSSDPKGGNISMIWTIFALAVFNVVR